MNIELSKEVEKKIRSMAEKLGLKPEELALGFVEEKVKGLEGIYPSDAVLAAQIAQDPDSPPLLDYETLKKTFKPMPPLDQLD